MSGFFCHNVNGQLYRNMFIDTLYLYNLFGSVGFTESIVYLMNESLID